MRPTGVPRILVVDDLFGRTHQDRRNEERANLCGQYLLVDVTGDETGKAEPQKIADPTAEAVFYRGQAPVCSATGDTVENDLKGVLRVVRQGWSEAPCRKRWAMVLVDLCFYTGLVTEESHRRAQGMPEGREGDDEPSSYFGIQVLRTLHEEFPDLPVVVLSSKPRDEVSRAFAYSGALGFLPREDSRSPELLREYLWRHGLVQDPTGEVVGHSRPLLIALRAARRAAASTGNILIRGERGSGKEFIARYIHRQGRGSQPSPFVVVNSAVLTAELFASELFGIERGIATGVEQRAGLVKSADGGDLFFDEISDMIPQAQAGILRVLEERQVGAIGGKGPVPVDVRFLSATNVDIESIAGTGAFRSDLLDRLRDGGTIVLPPLKDRKEDIPLLVERFVRDAEAAYPAALPRTIEPEALDVLTAYDWPGNVRELRSCIIAAVNSHPDVEHLVPVQLRLPGCVPARSVRPGWDDGLSEITRECGLTMAARLKAALESSGEPPALNGGGPRQLLAAMRQILNSPSLSATEASESVAAMFCLAPQLVNTSREDPFLTFARETARKMRTPVQRKSPNSSRKS